MEMVRNYAKTIPNLSPTLEESICLENPLPLSFTLFEKETREEKYNKHIALRDRIKNSRQ